MTHEEIRNLIGGDIAEALAALDRAALKLPSFSLNRGDDGDAALLRISRARQQITVLATQKPIEIVVIPDAESTTTDISCVHCKAPYGH